MLNPDCGIYTITSPSGRQYVGSTVSFKKRWNLHRCLLRLGRHHCTPLQRAFNKYGEAALKFRIVAFVPRDQLIAREQEQIDERGFPNLYNVLPNAASSLGRVLSPETRAKLRAAFKGREFSQDTKSKMRAAQLGRKQSPEVIAKRTATLIGREISADTRERIGAAQRGLPRAEAPNTSGHVGVVQTAWGKWRAQVGSTYLGHFDTAEAAAAALAKYATTGERRATRSNNTSGYPGVVARGSGWQASARIGGKRWHVGTFASPEAAHAAIVQFKQERS